jgi:hypothetical protein
MTRRSLSSAETNRMEFATPTPRRGKIGDVEACKMRFLQ